MYQLISYGPSLPFFHISILVIPMTKQTILEFFNNVIQNVIGFGRDRESPWLTVWAGNTPPSRLSIEDFYQRQSYVCLFCSFMLRLRFEEEELIYHFILLPSSKPAERHTRHISVLINLALMLKITSMLGFND